MPHDRRMHEGHVERYSFAEQFIVGKTVLDAACGWGGGTAILSEKAKSVVGVDIDPDNLEYAKENYSRKNITYSEQDVTQLSYSDNSFEAAVSLETIEHLTEADQKKYLSEFRRVVVPGGVIIISTPDRAIWRSMAVKQADHIRELTKKELLELLGRFFTVKSVYGQQRTVPVSAGRRAVRGFLNTVKRADVMGLRYKLVPAAVRSSLDERTTPIAQNQLKIESLQDGDLAAQLFVVCENRK
jgi:ubiquinone/menaquinone biosynthesis C-methylase UbiE